MPLLSELIIQICMLTADQKCVETLHVCMRDTFEINFYDTLTKEEEQFLPLQLKYCEAERILSKE